MESLIRKMNTKLVRRALTVPVCAMLALSFEAACLFASAEASDFEESVERARESKWNELEAAHAAMVLPYMEEHCIGCHGEEKQKGDRRFDRLDLNFGEIDTLEAWQDILDLINLGDMPPEDEEQPSSAATRKVVDWITSTLEHAHETMVKQDRGAVLRRMNAMEYRNTIRDLLHLNMSMFDPTESFPKDETEEGFDTIGEALVTSNYLLEQYLGAASKSLARATHDGQRPEAQAYRFTPPIATEKLEGLTRAFQKITSDYDALFTRPTTKTGYIVPKNFDGAPYPGYYRIRVKASGRNPEEHIEEIVVNPDEPLRLGVVAASRTSGNLQRINSTDVPLAEFELPDDGRAEDFEFTAWLDEGYVPRLSYPNGTLNKISYNWTEKYAPEGWTVIDRQKVSLQYKNDWIDRMYDALAPKYKGPSVRIYEYEIEGPLYESWPPSSHATLFGKGRSARRDARALLGDFAKNAYRRPVDPQELEPIFALVDTLRKDGASEREALLGGFKAILCSPDFLYLYENEGVLDDYALASRLSYFLWSSMPDETLFALAKKGRLSVPNILRRETLRMLADPKADAFVERFTDSWLMLNQIGAMPPDPDAFEIYYKNDLERNIKMETRVFFKHLLEENLSVAHFLDSDFTFVNESLAPLYEMDGVRGQAFRKVPVNAAHRGGLLGHASVLTATANGIETSPVIRGIWVLERILGTPPSPPPPDVEPLEPDIRGATTIREQLLKHRKTETCNDCHRKIDPPGFALENFDPIGGYRSIYPTGKLQVDASGALASGEAFQGIVDFKEILLDRQDQFARCLAEKLLIYATGRPLTPYDRPQVDGIVGDLIENGYGLRDLILLVVQSEPFLHK